MIYIESFIKPVQELLKITLITNLMKELHLLKAIGSFHAYKNKFHFLLINLSSMFSLFWGHFYTTRIKPKSTH